MKVHQPTVRMKETDSVRGKVPLSQSAATFLHLSIPSQGGLHSLDEYTSQTTNNTTLIGQDLWKQLKRVTIPVFSGDKRKLPDPMLAVYHRSVFKTYRVECVEVLRDWVIQEAEFHSRALETVQRLTTPKFGKPEAKPASYRE